jgi:hypothetical protein
MKVLHPGGRIQTGCGRRRIIEPAALRASGRPRGRPRARMCIAILLRGKWSV